MNQPSPTFPFGSPASPPDMAVLAISLVIVVTVVVVTFYSVNYCLNDPNRRAFMPPGARPMP